MRYGARSVASSRYGNDSVATSTYGDDSVASSWYDNESEQSSVYGDDSVASSWLGDRSVVSSRYGNHSTVSSNYGDRSAASSWYGNQSKVSSKYGGRSASSSMYDDRSMASSTYETPSMASSMASSTASLSTVSSYYTVGMKDRQQKKTRLAFQASRALQRRKRESERQILEQEQRKVREVDYETNVTSLYKMIEKKLWIEAVARCKQEPLEACTWVIRKEKGQNGKLKIRWKLLPIHTAVIFRAPITVIEALVNAFPYGPKLQDDQKMLPLHIACRNVSSEEIVSALIDKFPEALNIKDRKGRIPMDFLSENYERPQMSRSKAQQRIDNINRKRLVEILNEYIDAQGNLLSVTENNFDSSTFGGNESNSMMSPIKESDDTSQFTNESNWTENNSTSEKDRHCEFKDSINDSLNEEDVIDVSQLAIQNMASDGSKFFASFDGQNSQLSAIDERDETEEVETDANKDDNNNSWNMRSELSDENIGITLEPSAQLRSLMKVMTSSKISEYKSYTPYQGKLDNNVEFTETKTNTRRVNACGALKTLTKSNNSRIRLVRTKGIICSLCKVICDPKAVDEERIRCITTLLNLSTPSRNHELMYGVDGLRRSLTKALVDPNPIVRYNCCLIVMMLAKSEKNRNLMCRHHQLMDSIINIVYWANDIDEEDNDDKKCDSIENGILENANTKTKMDREYILKSRKIVMKIFLTFSKVKEVARQMVKNKQITKILAESIGNMSKEEDVLCVAVITNLTRDIANSKELVSCENLLCSLVKAVSSELYEIRECAVFALQNLSCCVGCRQDIAATRELLTAVARVAFSKDKPITQIATLHILRNLCNEPSNLITITDTPGVTATLLATANDKTNDEMAQYLACDTLATLSQWLRFSADSCIDKIPDDKLRHNHKIPSLRTTSWNQWK